jgi:hypothetical protein
LFDSPAAYRAPQDENLSVFLLIDDPMFPNLNADEVDPVERIVRIFSTAAHRAINPPRALKAYLRHYSLQSDEQKQIVRGLRNGKGVIEATFDDHNRLDNIIAL